VPWHIQVGLNGNFTRLFLNKCAGVNDLKKVHLVFPTDGITNAERDELKQVTTSCFLETASWNIFMFLCCDMCFPLVKQ
jgi:hypothetical protein